MLSRLTDDRSHPNRMFFSPAFCIKFLTSGCASFFEIRTQKNVGACLSIYQTHLSATASFATSFLFALSPHKLFSGTLEFFSQPPSLFGFRLSVVPSFLFGSEVFFPPCPSTYEPLRQFFSFLLSFF